MSDLDQAWAEVVARMEEVKAAHPSDEAKAGAVKRWRDAVKAWRATVDLLLETTR